MSLAEKTRSRRGLTFATVCQPAHGQPRSSVMGGVAPILLPIWLKERGVPAAPTGGARVPWMIAPRAPAGWSSGGRRSPGRGRAPAWVWRLPLRAGAGDGASI